MMIAGIPAGCCFRNGSVKPQPDGAGSPVADGNSVNGKDGQYFGGCGGKENFIRHV